MLILEHKPYMNLSNDNISVSRTKREGNIMDTITLQQAILDLAYKGPGGNGEVEKRLKAGHTLENSWFIYCVKKAQPENLTGLLSANTGNSGTATPV